MDFSQTVNRRVSIRRFLPKPVEDDVIRHIIETAERTPSWANSQPWRVYVATGESLEKIRAEHKTSGAGHADFQTQHRDTWSLATQKAMAAWSMQLTKYLGTHMSEMSRSNADLFDAPALVYLTIARNSTEWSVFDLGAFSQTLMLAAADAGVDSMAAYEIVKHPESVRRIMGIPDKELVAMGIALGYRDDTARINGFRSSRLPVDKVLTIKH